jgi:hypothetical protein
MLSRLGKALFRASLEFSPASSHSLELNPESRPFRQTRISRPCRVQFFHSNSHNNSSSSNSNSPRDFSHSILLETRIIRDLRIRGSRHFLLRIS